MFSFLNFLSKFPKSGVEVNWVIYKGILGKKSHNFWGQSVVGWPHFLATQPAREPFPTRSLPVAFYLLKDQHSYYGTVKL
jgi:hypothetical protein